MNNRLRIGDTVELFDSRVLSYAGLESPIIGKIAGFIKNGSPSILVEFREKSTVFHDGNKLIPDYVGNFGYCYYVDDNEIRLVEKRNKINW